MIGVPKQIISGVTEPSATGGLFTSISTSINPSKKSFGSELILPPANVITLGVDIALHEQGSYPEAMISERLKQNSANLP